MNNQGGYTLLEIGIVVSILGIVTAVAVPSLTSSDSRKLEIATTEIARAIDFARDEARRTGTLHGVSTDSINERIRIFRLPSILPVYDVRHPIDKKLYDIQLTTDPHVSGVDLVSSIYNFDGIAGNTFSFVFDENGMPVMPFGFPITHYMLTDATISLSYASQQKVISVTPMTGRVSVQ